MGSMFQALTRSDIDQQRVLLEVAGLNLAFVRRRGIISRRLSVVKALNNVSFELFQGEILAIVGESGSGKTTLAKCITRLLTPTSGSIKYNQAEVTKLTGKGLRTYRRDVQIVYQDPYESLNPRQDVLTAIGLPLYYLKGEKNSSQIRLHVLHLLEEVGLNSRVLRKLPHQLSGGERQRVNIARALASDPKLLVADEPITMLDAEQRLNILSLLSELKSKRNLSVIVVTHDLASAKVISDRMLVMYLGRIVESGMTQAILSEPLHPYVDLIREAMPYLRRSNVARERRSIAAIEESSDLSQGCVFRPRCKYATEICLQVEPELSEKSRMHWAACHNPLKR